MAECKYEGCKRKTWKKSEYCIFHEPSKDKDADLFWKGIDEMMKKEDYDFREFHFIPRKGENSINFVNFEFRDKVDFSGAKFLERTYFFRSIFPEKGTQFFWSIFYEDVSFDRATFLGDVQFTGTRFEGPASFDRTIFSNDAKFSWTRFPEGVWFGESKFHKDVTFDNSEFSGAFDEAEFFNLSNWERTKFREVVFSNIILRRPEQARFYHTDLSKATFSPTSGLERIDFLNPNWAGNERKELYTTEILERRYRKVDIANAYSEVETMYRQLKINYERKRNYPDAGDFYIGEMKMKMKNPKTSKFEKFILLLYKLISYYGESYKRALCWIVGLILLSAFILTCTGVTVEGRLIDYYNSLPPIPNYGKDYLMIVTVVLRAITLQPLTGFAQPTGLASWIVLTFTTIFGILFIALFTLALRRRFRR